jgi:predicted CXXCH cytochrome family protein
MRTLKLALTAIAAFATHASAQTPVNGMGNPPSGIYQPNLSGIPFNAAADNLNFHAGGVAACDGCHVMHNAQNGVQKSVRGIAPGELAWSNTVNSFLLQGSDQSSTCLICHSGTNGTSSGTQFVIATVNPAGAPANYSPGGDFGWLYKTYNNSPGAHHGHGVSARDFSLVGATNAAPGGTWTAVPGDPLGQFACSSCHDPHGRYRMVSAATPNGVGFAGPFPASLPNLPIASTGSYGATPVAGTYAVGAYRLLAGQRYAPTSNSFYAFANNPPIAVAPQTYNKTETPTTEARVAYGTGMSEWCQNCHVNIHMDTYSSGWQGLRHPAGSASYLKAAQYDMYNHYVASGNINTAITNNYTSLVPFEQGANMTLGALQANTGSAVAITAGSTNNVMCLSCHRAHASAFDSILRWDQNATFLTDGTNVTAGITSAALVTSGGGGPRPTADTTAGYYGRTMGNGFSPYQRSLCNKCHGKD